MWITKEIITKFEEKWYSGLITIDSIPDNKISLKIKSGDRLVDDVSVWGWEIKSHTQKIFLPDKLEINGEIKNTLDILPIKITSSYEQEYDKNVYKFVTGIEIFKIKPEKMLSFEQIFDLFKDIKHTNKTDFETYLSVVLSSIPLKYNFRIATTGGFGKSNIFGQICKLIKGNKIMKLKTESKVMKEAHLKTCLIFDEFTDVPEVIKRELDSFFKISGDGADKIQNPANKSAAYGTLDEYDTTLTSYGFFYNTYRDAFDKRLDKQYFDKIYDFPTRQRYFPMYFSGEIIGSQFDVPLKQRQQQYDIFESTYLKLIKSLFYYIKNPEQLDDGKEHWKWFNDKTDSLEAERLKHNFRQIQIGLKACSKTEQEYSERCDGLWNSYMSYNNQFNLEQNEPKLFGKY